ncbi:hypothetical protein B0J14DRAFT_167362 [Halenospora varia]|nr:hypothetical protein B0J14DRAFT_167362 [Halenospora varia]
MSDRPNSDARSCSSGPGGSIRPACVDCRMRKIRCLPGPEVGSCQRCHRQQKECIIPQRASRKRTHNKQLESQLDGIEKSLESVVSLLNENKSTPLANTFGGTVSNVARDISSTESPTTEPIIASDLSCSKHEDVFDLGLLSIEEAEKLCECYRNAYQSHFLYVVLPAKMNVQQLRQQRPLLLQAILSVMTWEHQTLQPVIGKHYLKDLSSRFFLDGECSLDILQSLLVYIAWYQFHLKIGGKQIYRLSCLAVTILLELGFDKGLAEYPMQQLPSQDRLSSSYLDELSSPEGWKSEARRATIGCYHYSTW